jgi:hypothetical protein
MTFFTYIALFIVSWVAACVACVINTSPKKLRHKNKEATLLGNRAYEFETEHGLDFRLIEGNGAYAAVIPSEDYLEFDDVVLIK